MSGIGGGIAVADGDDSTSSGPDGTSTASKVDNSSGATGGESQPAEKPTSTVGSGREATDEPRSSLSIPVLRWPTPEQVQEKGVSAFVATVDIPVPDVEAFSALPQPDPAPTPTPSFRTQEPSFRTQEEAPVVDAGGDGSDALSATNGEPPVLEAPLVVAPPVLEALRVVEPPPALFPSSVPVPSIGASAGGPGPRPDATEAVGANPPVVRGTVQQTTQQTTKPASSDLRLTPLSGQATRVGYPRAFRNPTLADLAAVALPGVAGLLFMTFSGGLLGYRQANSLRFIRMQGAERFLR
jgi:hypothetical protein